MTACGEKDRGEREKARKRVREQARRTKITVEK